MLDLLCPDFCYLESIDCILDILQHIGEVYLPYCILQMFVIFAALRQKWFLKGKTIFGLMFSGFTRSHGNFSILMQKYHFPLVLERLCDQCELVQWYEVTGVLGGSLWI